MLIPWEEFAISLPDDFIAQPLIEVMVGLDRDPIGLPCLRMENLNLVLWLESVYSSLCCFVVSILCGHSFRYSFSRRASLEGPGLALYITGLKALALRGSVALRLVCGLIDHGSLCASRAREAQGFVPSCDSRDRELLCVLNARAVAIVASLQGLLIGRDHHSILWHCCIDIASLDALRVSGIWAGSRASRGLDIGNC
jgi:hypothetical protein